MNEGIAFIKRDACDGIFTVIFFFDLFFLFLSWSKKIE